MLVPIRQWLPDLTGTLCAAFPDRLRFVGLQGSYRRGEATEKSDIDIVAVLDELRVTDLKTYRELVRAMPYGDRACGFLCGESELRAWPRFDLLQLVLDTEPVYGSLDGLLPAFTDKDAAQAVRTGASVLYHMTVHSFLYDADPANAFPALCKSACFLLRMQVYRDTGRYFIHKADLSSQLSGEAAAVLALCRAPAPADTDALERACGLLMSWSSALL